jgi:cobalamin biosynthesis Mg chelatase CobN
MVFAGCGAPGADARCTWIPLCPGGVESIASSTGAAVSAADAAAVEAAVEAEDDAAAAEDTVLAAAAESDAAVAATAAESDAASAAVSPVSEVDASSAVVSEAAAATANGRPLRFISRAETGLNAVTRIRSTADIVLYFFLPACCFLFPMLLCFRIQSIEGPLHNCLAFKIFVIFVIIMIHEKALYVKTQDSLAAKTL